MMVLGHYQVVETSNDVFVVIITVKLFHVDEFSQAFGADLVFAFKLAFVRLWLH